MQEYIRYERPAACCQQAPDCLIPCMQPPGTEGTQGPDSLTGNVITAAVMCFYRWDFSFSCEKW